MNYILWKFVVIIINKKSINILGVDVYFFFFYFGIEDF